MRILIVDDAEDKRRDVRCALQAEFQDQYTLELDEAVDYEEALERLRDGFYDLVVLDLFLPDAVRSPTDDVSKALIKQVVRGDRLIPPTHIIGLTAYPLKIECERPFYDEHLLALLHYDAVDSTWRTALCSRIRYLVASKRAAARFRLESYDFDLVVMTARHENEYVPVAQSLFKRKVAEEFLPWAGMVSIGEVAGPGQRPLKTALVCIGEMGMAPAAAAASEAMNLFRPRMIAMVGMCCGFNTSVSASPRKLLDVLVAREVACWEEGKYESDKQSGDGQFRNRAKTRLVDDAIRNQVEQTVEQASAHLTPRLRRVANTKQYKAVAEQFDETDIRAIPEVKFSPIVSGSSVVADDDMITEILGRHPNALGLDMEIAGLHAAVDRCLGKKPSVLAVKGVADFGRADKGANAQVMASRCATEVFLGIIGQLDIFEPNRSSVTKAS
ncbi:MULTISPECIES: response regulator [unclassified Brevundimonas]|uniref:response regulator n=1 Tax=unclassified Brevundimonas TaxID=2622653 RepID=UPI000CFAB0BA|nr:MULTISPECIES: response regulator [unclassified Brevundimonas]PRA27177.1 hypothetical protein CQ024_11775 [Brevundimonas sp. MYb27]PQZ77362.1 hypothetical protein CQ026_13170 [Brevundimonas sp. MYb31]PRB17594.1 hypothetical protein CQ039_00705 [Brevundimonas sp. MYb52]PRB37966.1 hypothetical protein CQ035_00705 [Brevundimonas sp. MYb46]PRB46315.1 hypothetical protein CQ028_11870 [Brevundimonas sp. MYb33]